MTLNPWEIFLVRRDQATALGIEALNNDERAKDVLHLVVHTLRHSQKTICLFCDRVPGVKVEVVGALVPIKRDKDSRAVCFVICEACARARQDDLNKHVMKSFAEGFGVAIVPIPDGGRA